MVLLCDNASADEAVHVQRLGSGVLTLTTFSQPCIDCYVKAGVDIKTGRW
jgi:hypothetical protein